MVSRLAGEYAPILMAEVIFEPSVRSAFKNDRSKGSEEKDDGSPVKLALSGMDSPKHLQVKGEPPVQAPEDSGRRKEAEGRRNGSSDERRGGRRQKIRWRRRCAHDTRVEQARRPGEGA